MPMVSATDIPLQPYPTGRTSPQAPDAYQQIQTAPSMFGSIEGEALQQAGQQGEKLATSMAQIGAYQKRYLDLAEVDKLAAERDDERHKEYYGDPAAGVDPITGRALRPGLKNLYGSEAIDYIKSGAPSKAFNDTVNRIAGTASNETVRQMFLHQSRAQRTAFDEVVGSHFSSQLLKHNENIQKARSSIAERDAASAETDAELIDAIKRNVDAHINAQAYSDPTLAEAARREATARSAISAINGRIAAGQLDRARTLYNTFRDSFTGQQLDAVDKELTVAGERQQAKEEAELGEDFANGLLGRPTRGRAPGARTGGTNAAEHYATAISLGASPNEAALLTSAADAESGFNAGATHDAAVLAKRGLPPGYGLYGHNAERLAAMRREFGPRPTAAQQIEFALKELRSRPEGARVNAATTPEELTELQFQFEQPKRGPGDQADRRLASTRAYMRNPPSPGAPATRAGSASGSTAAAPPPAPGAGAESSTALAEPDADLGGGLPAAATPAEKPPPDWAGMATRLRDSNLPAGAKAKAMQIIENDKRMYEFGTAEYKTKYNAAALAAVEQRKDEIVQVAVRSDDPGAHAKAQTDLAAIVKWGVDSGAVPANDAYRFERQAKGDLITGRAQYLDAIGQTEAALAYIQQNKDSLPAAAFQQQVQSLQGKAEEAQGTRFVRDLRVGVGGVGQIGVPPPQGAPDFPLTLAPAPLQQRLQAIADSDLPDRAKKTARERIVAEHQLQIVGQGQAASDLNAAVESGLATRLDVEQAYRDERISPEARTSLNNKFDKIDADRLAGAQAMLKVENAGKGGAPLDPKSTEDKKALNYHFEQVTAAQEQANAVKRAQGLPVPDATANAIDYSVKYGLIPEKFKGAIRGNLHSADPARIVAAADTIAQLRNRTPQLVSEIGDEDGLRLAALVHTYAGAGVEPVRAVELATAGLKVSKLEREARGEQFNEARGKTPQERHDADTTWLTGQLNSFWQADPNTVEPLMRKEFEEVSKVEYERTGNLEAARTMALSNINNAWGRTRVGGGFRYMKLAPENPKFYGVPSLSPDDNGDWMNEQLLADVQRQALQDPTNPITSDRVMLMPAHDRRAPDGRPRYYVHLNHPVTGLELIRKGNGDPMDWAPDWNTSPEKLRRDAALRGEIEDLRTMRPGDTRPSLGRGLQRQFLEGGIPFVQPPPPAAMPAPR